MNLNIRDKKDCKFDAVSLGVIFTLGPRITTGLTLA